MPGCKVFQSLLLIVVSMVTGTFLFSFTKNGKMFTKKIYYLILVWGWRLFPAMVTLWQVKDVFFRGDAVLRDRTQDKIKPPPIMI